MPLIVFACYVRRSMVMMMMAVVVLMIVMLNFDASKTVVAPLVRASLALHNEGVLLAFIAGELSPVDVMYRLSGVSRCLFRLCIETMEQRKTFPFLALTVATNHYPPQHMKPHK